MNTTTYKIVVLLLMNCAPAVDAFNCREIVQDMGIINIDWHFLSECLVEVNNEVLPGNASANVWRLVKSSFDGIENIPMDAFKYLGYMLTAIPLEELRNLSMERVEIVEAFGSVRSSDDFQGFSDDQSSLIAQKVRNEWLGKNPDTYSEYDLRSMGEIVCHLSTTDIEELHPDAFKNAAEWIGNIKNCPQDRLQAFAKLAKNEDAFGEPSKWSKMDVSVLGNIIKGLPQSDIAVIDKDILRWNRYYALNIKNIKAEGRRENTSPASPTNQNETSSNSRK